MRTNLGEALLLMGRLDEARGALAAAIPSLVAIGNLDAQTNARVNLGRVLLAIGEAPAAQAELERALQLREATGGRNHAARAWPKGFDWATVHPELSVTMSIGVSADLTLISHERLLADADTHLYRAKRDGKNRVRWNGN